MSEHTYVLDSEGLSRWARGDRRMGSLLKDAALAGIPVVTTSMTLVGAYHAKVFRPAWRWALSRLRVEPVTDQVANEAIDLLQAAGLHGHMYAIDAALVAVALRQPGRVTIFTSDEEDMRLLSKDRAVVVRL